MKRARDDEDVAGDVSGAEAGSTVESTHSTDSADGDFAGAGAGAGSAAKSKGSADSADGASGDFASAGAGAGSAAKNADRNAVLTALKHSDLNEVKKLEDKITKKNIDSIFRHYVHHFMRSRNFSSDKLLYLLEINQRLGGSGLSTPMYIAIDDKVVSVPIIFIFAYYSYFASIKDGLLARLVNNGFLNSNMLTTINMEVGDDIRLLKIASQFEDVKEFKEDGKMHKTLNSFKEEVRKALTKIEAGHSIHLQSIVDLYISILRLESSRPQAFCFSSGATTVQSSSAKSLSAPASADDDPKTKERRKKKVKA